MQIKQIGNHRLLYVMAAAPEYGEHLQERFVPLMTGIGPVEAAVVLSAELARLNEAGELPDLIVSLGSAGSAKLPQTEVYQASSVCYRDMDASPLGFEKGQTPLLDLPIILDMPVFDTGIPSASLATGASIVSGAHYDEIYADMVDMETFALLRACHRFDVPLIGLRGISDGAEELGHVDDWTQYLHVVDENLSDAVDRMETCILEHGLVR